ncbi:MAG: hypothetical protein HY718_00915 [Planctomycetes bacterium]|nr:hypothetical protein [Planctomycetota bacterium]
MQNEAPPTWMPPPRRRIPVLKIIGTVLLILVLICGGLVTYVAYNFPRWAAGLARGPLIGAVDGSDLPDDQKTLIKQNLTRVADAFQDRRISYTQFKTIFQKLASGPFFHLVGVESMRYQYGLAHPTMDDERRQTMLSFDRFERGIVENTIPSSKVSEVMALVHDPDQHHGPASQPAITEAQLKPFIDAMRVAVEEAKIPAEPFQADFAGEIDKAVSAVLGPSAGRLTSLPAETMPASQGAE